MSAPWLLTFGARPGASVRLFCLSSAGSGAAMYRPLRDAMPDHVEVCAVQLPGRESRLRDPPFTSIAAIADTLVRELQPCLDRPFALFGHSMGALAAFELARRLQARGGPMPGRLMVSARRAPQLPETDAPIHALPDDALVAEIGRRYGGIPPEVLQHRDLLELLLPGLRADLQAVETHRHHDGEPLRCPITAFGGTDDTRVTPGQLDAWSVHGTAGFRRQVFEGGHFYFQHTGVRARLIDSIVQDLCEMPISSNPETAK